MTSTTRTTSTTRRRRLVAVAAAALVLGSAGSATAARLITGAQIKDGTVQSRDVADRSLTGRDVKDMSLTPADFTELPRGPQGPQGPAGPRGQAGASGLQYVTEHLTIPVGETSSWGAACPAGKKVLGGGVSSNNPYYARIVESAPLNGGAGWWVGVRNQHTIALDAYAWAVCAAA